MSEEQTALEDTRNVVQRIVDFDANSLVRSEDLGKKFAFEDAVDPAQRIQGIFLKLPIDALSEFPDSELNTLKTQANNVYNLFDQILAFDNTQPEATTKRDTLVSNLNNQYQPVFSTLFPLISYAVARTVDFQKLAADGRAAVQSVRDESAKVMDELGATSEKAAKLLQDVREAAAEQGVTQQAKYFSDQANEHQDSASQWLVASSGAAGVLIAYVSSTLFFSQIDIFTASNVPEAIQLTASKILVFIVLGFVLLQCVKNYSAHRHNSVTNRHRQNALMTYTTLAEAGASREARDTVLQHAAAAIYAPNDTGYIKAEERGYGGNPVIGISPRSIASSGFSGDGS